MTRSDDSVTNLLEREVYGFEQVDRLLGLRSGTARRWIDGYERRGRTYPPVVRLEPTGNEIVTWGEFVETRLLGEYRDAGVPMLHMRPAIDELRRRFHPTYPLAHAKPYVSVAGRELVLQVQDEVGLDRKLALVVIRSDQLVLSEPAENFYRSAEFDENDVVERLQPAPDIPDVVFDPLRQFGEPIIRGRGVRTEIIAELVRAGEDDEAIAEHYELPLRSVKAAVRFELIRNSAAHEAA